MKIVLLQEAKKKIFDVVELLGSYVSSSTFDNIACIPIVCELTNCKKDGDDVVISSHELLATTNNISPIFAKHTTGIGLDY